MFVTFFHEDSERYERFQPQGRRYVGTGEQDGGRGRRTDGERGGRIRQVSERRSRAGGATALDQGVADRGREVTRTCELYGPAFGLAQMKLLPLFALVFAL